MQKEIRIHSGTEEEMVELMNDMLKNAQTFQPMHISTNLTKDNKVIITVIYASIQSSMF